MKNKQTDLEDLIKRLEDVPVPERTCNIDTKLAKVVERIR